MLVPRNIEEALNDPHWKLAIMKEMNALIKSGVWDIIDLQKDNKTIGCKKCKADDGSIERYKARIMAKGFI